MSESPVRANPWTSKLQCKMFCNVLHAGFPFQIPSNEFIFVYFLTISTVLDKRAPRVFGMKIYQDPCATALLAEGRSNHGDSG